MNETAYQGESQESLHDTIDRVYDEPAHIGNQGYYDLVTKEIAAAQMEVMTVAMTDLTPQLPMISADTRVQATNGGTIDVYAVSAAAGAAKGSIFVNAATTTYTNFSIGSDNFYLNGSSANAFTSMWAKTATGPRSLSIPVIYKASSTIFSTHPTFTVTIPAGVPGGRLRIIGFRKPLAYAYAANGGAGADLAASVGFNTAGCTVAVSDGTNTYWTWAASSGNEEYSYSLNVSKATSASYSVDITSTTTITDNSTDKSFVLWFDLEYYPNDVKLSNLDSMNVDIGMSDPVARIAELMYLYDSYCDRHNQRTFMEILNNRLDASYSDSLIYPQNWNTASFDNFTDFLNEYIEVYKIRRVAILADIGFATTL
jgi:hypothetical protein